MRKISKIAAVLSAILAACTTDSPRPELVSAGTTKTDGFFVVLSCDVFSKFETQTVAFLFTAERIKLVRAGLAYLERQEKDWQALEQHGVSVPEKDKKKRADAAAVIHMYRDMLLSLRLLSAAQFSHLGMLANEITLTEAQSGATWKTCRRQEV